MFIFIEIMWTGEDFLLATFCVKKNWQFVFCCRTARLSV